MKKSVLIITAHEIWPRTMPPRLTKAEVRRGDLPFGGMSQEYSIDMDKHYGNTGQG